MFEHSYIFVIKACLVCTKILLKAHFEATHMAHTNIGHAFDPLVMIKPLMRQNDIQYLLLTTENTFCDKPGLPKNMVMYMKQQSRDAK